MLYTVWSKHENEEEICINLNPFLGNDLNTKQILWEFKRFSLMRHYLIKKTVPEDSAEFKGEQFNMCTKNGIRLLNSSI